MRTRREYLEKRIGACGCQMLGGDKGQLSCEEERVTLLIILPSKSLLPAMLYSLGELQSDSTCSFLQSSFYLHPFSFYLPAVLEQPVIAQNYCTVTNMLQQTQRRVIH